MPRRSVLAAVVIALFLPLMTCASARAAETGTTTGVRKPATAAHAHHPTHLKKKHGHQVKRLHHHKTPHPKKQLHHRRRIHKRVSTLIQ